MQQENRKYDISIRPGRECFLVLVDGVFYASCDSMREAEEEAEEIALKAARKSRRAKRKKEAV